MQEKGEGKWDKGGQARGDARMVWREENGAGVGGGGWRWAWICIKGPSAAQKPVPTSTSQWAGVSVFSTGRAAGRKKGSARVRMTLPTAPLQTRVVSGSSMATRRVTRYWAANRQAVISPNTVPTGSSPEPGRIMINTPAKPTPAATHRDSLGGSPNSHGASASTRSGARKLMAVASAWGR